jgi:hypothetical protein
LHLVRRQKACIYDHRTNLLRLALPELLRRLQTSHSEEEVVTILQDALTQSELEGVEIESDAGGRKLESLAPPSGTRDLVRAAYPIGREDRARAKIRFLFRSDEADVRPEVAILLQLLVDAAAIALARTGSRLAPAPPDSRPADDFQEVALTSSTGARA